MEKGELSSEPELHMDVHSKDRGGGSGSWNKISATTRVKVTDGGKSESVRGGIEADAFFEDDRNGDDEGEGTDEDEDESE